MSVTTRAMRWWDIEPLLELEADLFGVEAWSAGMFWSELAQADTRHYLVAEDRAAAEAGALVGYAGLAAAGDEASVQTVAVRRDRWGRGEGRALVELLLAEADRRGARAVDLEVRADDERAQALYRRCGFAPVGRRRGYYQASGADAVLMRRVS